MSGAVGDAPALLAVSGWCYSVLHTLIILVPNARTHPLSPHPHLLDPKAHACCVYYCTDVSFVSLGIYFGRPVLVISSTCSSNHHAHGGTCFASDES